MINSAPIQSSDETENDRSPGLALLLVLAITFLHFMFARPFGFPLTPAPFAVLLVLTTLYTVRVKSIHAMVLLLLIAAPILVHFTSIISGNVDFDEYLKTYALWVFNITTIYIASKSDVKHNTVAVGNAAFISLAIISVFVSTQVLLASVFDTNILYNLFGEFQYLGETDLARLTNSSGFLRGTGLYLEPSFCAFVILTLYTTCLLGGKKAIQCLGISAVGILFTQSFSGILSLIAVTLLASNSLKSNSRASRVTWFLFSAGVFLLFYVLLGDYLVSRFLQVESEGTSTYYRILAPLIILKDVLSYHPLGVPFGQLESFIEPYQMLNGAGAGSTIDNGVYLLVFYFGWLGVAAVAYTAYRLFTALLKWQTSVLFLLAYIILGLQFSGGIMLPEYGLLTILVIYQYRVKRINEITEQAS